MDVPRLHFTGQFRTDVNTGNNQNCNFDLNNKINPERNWNSAGTQDFEFINTVITTVIDKDGNEDTESKLVGAEIFNDEDKPLGKIVDLDVDFQVSSIFGLTFGLKHNGVVLLVGNWTPCVIVHDMWEKVKCTQGPFHPARSICFGVQSTTKIVDIVWSDSPLISEFKSASQKSSDQLQVSITLDSFSCDVYTIGRVYGTIGITNNNEPLCVGGERKMVPVDPGLLNFGKDHPCSKYPQEDEKPWTNDAPFKFDSSRNVLVVDLSNSLPTHFSRTDKQEVNSQLDIGELHFGYILNDQINPIGDNIPYLKSDMWKRSGIVEVSIDESDISNIQNSKLAVFTEFVDNSSSNPYKILFHSGTEFTLLLWESELFVRPMGYYMARLQHPSQLSYGNSFMSDSHEFTLLVTKFGKPANDTPVTLKKSYNQFGQETKTMAYPKHAVKYEEETKRTNETGHAKFKFTLEEKIPLKRHYTIDPKCEAKSIVTEDEISQMDESDPYYILPIDGQVYNFYYCVEDNCILPDDNPFFLYDALISILAFSTITYDDNYEPTWEDDVKSIFEQQNHLARVMRGILDMSNFTEVTEKRNIELLKYALSKDSKEAFEMDPNYMPTTRNLSPVKRKMILKWLDRHCYNKSTCVKPMPISNDVIDYTRCSMTSIPFDSDPQDQDTYLNKIITEHNFKLLKSDIAMDNPPRPLFGVAIAKEKDSYPTVSGYFGDDSELLKINKSCTLEAIQEQLKMAVQLEFYTIPLYITSLYSIIEHHNKDAYLAIREVVMQEMLHFVQAANILIATGGNLTIDDRDFAPEYPHKGLPGGVHSNLEISLQNYNLEHVHNTFMMIELPIPHKRKLDDPFVLYTIGMFYDEIITCINNSKALGNDIFADNHGNKELQVTWPWGTPPKAVGTVHIINDTNSAIEGINEIIEQGEGAGYLDPNQIDTGEYAHYYRFEELVCQNRLRRVDNKNYAFDGAPIVYDKFGVYPMYIPNKDDGFLPNSDCYTLAKSFHGVYRSLLRVLDKTFNGEPQRITEAVELMESLLVHAKRCLSTPYMTYNYNCGLIWDYEWN